MASKRNILAPETSGFNVDAVTAAPSPFLAAFEVDHSGADVVDSIVKDFVSSRSEPFDIKSIVVRTGLAPSEVKEALERLINSHTLEPIPESANFRLKP